MDSTLPKSSLNRSLRAFALVVCLLAAAGCETALPPVSSLEVATVGLHAAALSSDGDLAVVGSIYHGGSFWQLDSQERKYNWNHTADEPSTITVADISTDKTWALTADPATLVLWDIKSGEAHRYWTAPGEILSASLGPGANTALLGLSDHSAVLFDIQRGGIKQTFKHRNRVRSVHLSDDGRLALTGSEDYSARLWDTRNGEQLLRLKHEDDVQLVRLSGDGSMALSVSKYDKALLWHTRDADVICELPLHAQHIKRGITFTTAAFSSDNQYLLTGRPDQLVQLWQLPECQETARWRVPKRHRWKPTSAAVLAVAFGEVPGRYTVSASNGFIHHLEMPGN